MKVINRSDGNVAYSLPELNVRRVFTPGSYKDIDQKELEALWQTDGGHNLIVHYLLIEDRDWVKAHWDAPIEYFWQAEQITKCLKEDDLELFKETLDYAPAGVMDLIKAISWRMPLTDLNKIAAIKDKTGFDVMQAIEVMKSPAKKPAAPVKQRRRREEV